MRNPTSRENIRQVMQAIGDRIRQPLKVYFTGGTTCVLKGWRDSTVDIDLKPVPDLGKVYEALVRYPAIDEKALADKVELFLKATGSGKP